MNWTAILIGAASFLIIGLFHPLVIWSEYNFGKGIWPLFLIAGLAFLLAALLIKTNFWAIILSLVGFSCLWSIKELFDQEKRVQKGWFPANPKRRHK
jgi:hypothetical protein